MAEAERQSGLTLTNSTHPSQTQAWVGHPTTVLDGPGEHYATSLSLPVVPVKAKNAMQAMLQMDKIDIEGLKRAAERDSAA